VESNTAPKEENIFDEMLRKAQEQEKQLLLLGAQQAVGERP
jgi:hypothetical protein